MSTRIKVDRIAYGGSGVSRLPQGKTVFVDETCPGDVVDIEIVEEHSKWARANVVELVESSPVRVKARCPYFGVCGGCPWQIIERPSQLEYKRQSVIDSLTKIGKIELDVARTLVDKCVFVDADWGYRNKIELEAVQVDGKLVLGYHKKGSKEIVPIEKCLLFAPQWQKSIKSLTGALRYLKALDHGLLRVGIRTSARTKKTQLALWTNPEAFPRKAAVDILSSSMKGASIVRVLTHEKMKARKPSKVEVLNGDERWNERLLGLKMQVSAPSFFQVNTEATEELVKIALDGLEVSEEDICCDLYCGVGTFTLPLARISPDVVAIESSSSSIRDLRINLERNNLDAEVIGGDAAKESAGIGEVDKLIVDPPYSGLAKEVFERIEELNPKRMAYISCNPTTLARDLKILLEMGFELRKVTPVDLFPQTFHVETVAILSRKSTA